MINLILQHSQRAISHLQSPDDASPLPCNAICWFTVSCALPWGDNGGDADAGTEEEEEETVAVVLVGVSDARADGGLDDWPGC